MENRTSTDCVEINNEILKMNLVSFKTFVLECLSLSSFIKFIKTSSTVKVTFDDTSKDKDALSTIGKSNMKECS